MVPNAAQGVYWDGGGGAVVEDEGCAGGLGLFVRGLVLVERITAAADAACEFFGVASSLRTYLDDRAGFGLERFVAV